MGTSSNQADTAVQTAGVLTHPPMTESELDRLVAENEPEVDGRTYIYTDSQTMPRAFYDEELIEISVPVTLTFRQHRDESGHCQYAHTYDTNINFGVLEKHRRDPNVENFRQEIKALSGTFLVAADDPKLSKMVSLGAQYGTKCLVVPHVGCERLAEWLRDLAHQMDVPMRYIEVREHESNAGGVFFHPKQHRWLYYSMKTYTETRGLTTTFIQDGKIRGGSLKVSVLFASEHLDNCNWVVPFGQLKTFKDMLDADFDHSFLVDQHQTKFDLDSIGHVVCMERPSTDSIASRVKHFAEIWLGSYLDSMLDNAGVKRKSNTAAIRAANLNASGTHVAGVSIMLMDGHRRGYDKLWTHATEGLFR